MKEGILVLCPVLSVKSSFFAVKYAASLGFPGGTSGKEPARQCRRHKKRVRSLDREDPLEEGKATQSRTAWKIARTEEPGGL